MKIDFTKNQEVLTIALNGRLDTTTAPEFDEFIRTNISGVSAIEIDCTNLSYVSSAGLRVLLSAHKRMMGALTLANVCELVMEVFEITGFCDILKIK